MLIWTHEQSGSCIYAWPVGGFDADMASHQLGGGGGLYGLDTEGTWMEGAGVFSADWKLRMVQLATEHRAVLLNMEDPNQKDFAQEFFNRDDNSYVAHTDHDTMAVYVALDIDIAPLTLDMRMVATMASPDDRMGGNDLKTLAQLNGMPWLKAAQSDLDKAFVELWERSHPGIKAGKDEKEKYGWANIDIQDNRYAVYAGLDAIAVRRLVPILVHRAQAPASLMKMETWLDSQAARLRMRGMRVDVHRLAKMYFEVSEHCRTHEEEFGKIATYDVLKGRGDKRGPVPVPIKPRSGKRVSAWLHSHGADFTGYPLTDTGKELVKKGALTLNDEVAGVYASMSHKHKKAVSVMPLDELGQLGAHHLFEFKEKIYEVTKLEEIQKVMDPDHYVHSVLRTIGAVTGRMSSSGPNFQNFSKKKPAMRELFIPSPGKIFVAADFDQIELRVVAALSRETDMIETILAGGDLHQLTADKVGVDREMAKIVGFLIVYGGGAGALNEQTGVPLSRCKEVIAEYRAAYPQISKYAKKMGMFRDEIRTVSNRRIPVTFNKDGDARSYANINYDVQSAARDMVCRSWFDFAQNPGLERAVWLVIHDEIIAEVDYKDMDYAMEALERSMTFDYMGVPIAATAIPLADKKGDWRWTTGKAAEEYAQYRKDNRVPLKAV